LTRQVRLVGSLAPPKLIHHQNNQFRKFSAAKAGQTDLGCGIFPVFRKDGDELIYGGPEKFNQSKGG
jgi:hypothetical protein